jgi:hypothetical protein
MAYDDFLANDQATIDFINTDGSVGPQNDGTYSYPNTAQPNNKPWEAGGGSTADYGSDILGILKYGVGAFANVTAQKNMLDYKRYEATAGGLYQQGRPAGYRPGYGYVNGAQPNNMLFWVLIIGGAVLLLKKD